jgi:pyruvate dehydrogenase E1 component alpha subunit
LLFDTYRQLEHCGTLNDDHYKYRDETEINYWFDNDPVLNYGKFLINQGITTQADIEILENIINIRIQSELNLAIKANFPDPESISNNVYKF